ncbi:MAG: hypothetical protein AAFV30_01860 [Pseudomonadota bacterium]
MVDVTGLPLIVFVPGMKPKPPAELHLDALRRCLLEGLGRVDPDVAADLTANPDAFVRASWTYGFYKRYRDIQIDLPGIEALCAQARPSARDVEEATAWKTRLTRWLYLAGDALPFLVASLANDDMRVTLRDVRRYIQDEMGMGEAARADLRQKIVEASEAGRPVLVIGHSLGSVIGWDTLWALSRRDGHDAGCSLLMTLGSPLGNHIMQRGMMGHDREGAERYPDNIGDWVNVVAIGELTALDRCMRNDFREMESLGLVNSIEDYDVFNHYRENGRLVVHSEYGYLVNALTAGIIADWWRHHREGMHPTREDVSDGDPR